MFLRSDLAIDEGGGAAVLSSRVLPGLPEQRRLDQWRQWLRDVDWAPDLGARIGSADWYRGAATCLALCTATCLLSPGFNSKIIGDVPAPLSGSDWEDARAQIITPLAEGADTGRRLAANNLVRRLGETPERPIISLTATLGGGDDFRGALERAGVSSADAVTTANAVTRAVALNDVKPGTQLDLTLGRRPAKGQPRPLEAMKFRARFDLFVDVNRVGQQLVMTKQPIAIDNTPLRIRGLVGSSLYRAARAAGAPAKAVETYIRALASRVSVGRDLRASDTFDLTLERQRAATGEVQLGNLLYAGLDHGDRKVELVRWGDGDHAEWYDAKGIGEHKGMMSMPVAGHVTSGFGMRFHPILNFMKMHKGMDIGAPYGSPIHAAMSGTVAFAGRSGGYGNFVKLVHGGGLASGYGHMSRIAVAPGTRVQQGQVIGYVGSTGLSTGPHLHYELWRNGVSVNPRSISFSTVEQLSGAALKQFKQRVAWLLSVKPGK
ncbi:M23 family metallopeptidase [Sphingomonas sp. GlSt437]|uniref:M23 family metallopeptidase n=1 Tax=Sphingomonas sp. GlSt437 TaxID=3389970 RepID=UPI003A8620C7